MFCYFLLDVMDYILDSKKKTDHKTLIAADFYLSRLQIRNNDFKIMSSEKKLTQQYAVDQWGKIEAVRQDWVRRIHKS